METKTIENIEKQRKNDIKKSLYLLANYSFNTFIKNLNLNNKKNE